MFTRKRSMDSSKLSSCGDSGSDEDEIVPNFGRGKLQKQRSMGQRSENAGLRQKYGQQAPVRPVSAKTWGMAKQQAQGQGQVRTYHNDLYDAASLTPGDVLGSQCDDSDSSRAPSSLATSNFSSPMQHIRRLQSQKSLSAQKRAERLSGALVAVNSNMYNNRTVQVRPPSALSQRQGLTQQNLHRITSNDSEQLSIADSAKANSAVDLEERLKSQGIKSVYDPAQESEREVASSIGYTPQSDIQLVDVNDVRSFLMAPAPKGTMVQCYIVRERSYNGGLPRYVLYLEDGGRFLLAARKRRASKTANYLISLDEQDMDRQSGTFFGKVRANFVGTEFTVYDRGFNPSRDPRGEQGPVGSLAPRCEYAHVAYEMNMLGTKGPRKMTAIIPKVDRISNERRVFRPENDKQQCLQEAYRKGTNTDDEVLVLRNKPPRWNEQLQVYCLNFNGRVTHASVKNFQLVAESDMDYTVLQFGKISKDTFTMDFQWPMSPFQAFGICLSSFDNKVACQ
eukprot:TRINITY_DN11354_c0_g1_i1.p1 TRINITY_DN11354_c0_g1~~TRINITY_DN11354_c0_g1_i1.p1  ORF type:complete len:508 (+),score=56.59 TRINITY_DN11354_c0_g1_i1:220-1743(+)